ncbi:hypothetical protein [Aerosakkonema sp. BLCC-F183]|uniref:hypothetical protein n=1 Tax=Aerosakkonema sp. BLCC-F183 TaxID=3342834 RepID=UPI0035BBB95F
MKYLITQTPQTNQIPIKSIEDGILIVIPFAISITAYAIKEFIKLELKRKNAEYLAEIERRKLDQKEKTDRIEYLEKQNQMLFEEIISFRRMLEISGPISLSMYEPGKKVNPQNR